MPHINPRLRAGAIAAGLLLHLGPAAAQSPADALLAAERAVPWAAAETNLPPPHRRARERRRRPLARRAGRRRTEPVRRLLSAQRLLDSLRITWQPLGAELSPTEPWARLGRGGDRTDGAAPQLGRYIAAWRKESGAWKLAAFVGPRNLPDSVHRAAAGCGPSPAAAAPRERRRRGIHCGGPRLFPPRGDSGAALAFGRYAAPEAFMFGGGITVRGPEAIGRARSREARRARGPGTRCSPVHRRAASWATPLEKPSSLPKAARPATLNTSRSGGACPDGTRSVPHRRRQPPARHALDPSRPP